MFTMNRPPQINNVAGKKKRKTFTQEMHSERSVSCTIFNYLSKGIGARIRD